MEKDISKYVGLDVHKDSIVIAVAEAGRERARVLATIKHDVGKLLKVLAKLGAPETVKVFYEAGPTGYGLARALGQRGYDCQVVAPSLVPRRPGDRVKTDSRDALRLAELGRAGELSAVTIPDAGDEAVRDLSRARQDALKALQQARLQLGAFLLRQDLRYPGKTRWTKSFHSWLASVNLKDWAQQTVLTEYQLAEQAAVQRLDRLTTALIKSIEGWRMQPVVNALLALRGVDQVCAIGLVAEIGDVGRFAHPRQLMSYLGLVPSEHSSGERTRRGSVTKAGNSHARRVLVQAAWNYRFSPRVGPRAQLRARDLPEPVRAIGWKAQQRLHGRMRALNERGVHANKVCVAVARELSGFVWAIAKTMQGHADAATAPTAHKA